ncbi:MAG: hypothetical protein GXO62_00475 [Epsilonproteobacteria bacterium]|nr:hypothetical protein [Campylobacterota bacterium]
MSLLEQIKAASLSHPLTNKNAKNYAKLISFFLNIEKPSKKELEFYENLLKRLNISENFLDKIEVSDFNEIVLSLSKEELIVFFLEATLLKDLSEKEMEFLRIVRKISDFDENIFEFIINKEFNYFSIAEIKNYPKEFIEAFEKLLTSYENDFFKYFDVKFHLDLIPKSLRNKDFMKQYFEHSFDYHLTSLYKYVWELFEDDLNIAKKKMLNKIIQNITSWSLEELKKIFFDRDIVLILTQHDKNIITNPYKNDQEFLKEVAAYNPTLAIKNSDKKNDKEFVKKAIKEGYLESAKYIGSELEKDVDFIKDLIKEDKNIFEFLNVELKNDEDIFKYYLEISNSQIPHFEIEELKNRKIVDFLLNNLEADLIPVLFENLSYRLKNCEELIIKLLKKLESTKNEKLASMIELDYILENETKLQKIFDAINSKTLFYLLEGQKNEILKDIIENNANLIFKKLEFEDFKKLINKLYYNTLTNEKAIFDIIQYYLLHTQSTKDFNTLIKKISRKLKCNKDFMQKLISIYPSNEYPNSEMFICEELTKDSEFLKSLDDKGIKLVFNFF